MEARPAFPHAALHLRGCPVARPQSGRPWTIVSSCTSLLSAACAKDELPAVLNGCQHHGRTCPTQCRAPSAPPTGKRSWRACAAGGCAPAAPPCGLGASGRAARRSAAEARWPLLSRHGAAGDTPTSAYGGCRTALPGSRGGGAGEVWSALLRQASPFADYFSHSGQSAASHQLLLLPASYRRISTPDPAMLGRRYNEQMLGGGGMTEGWQKDILRRARRGEG